MATLMAIYAWLIGPKGAIMFAVLLGISEALDQIPAIEANSIYQAIVNGIKFIKAKLFPAAAA